MLSLKTLPSTCSTFLKQNPTDLWKDRTFVDKRAERSVARLYKEEAKMLVEPLLLGIELYAT